jgi:hypothetical protein
MLIGDKMDIEKIKKKIEELHLKPDEKKQLTLALEDFSREIGRSADALRNRVPLIVSTSLRNAMLDYSVAYDIIHRLPDEDFLKFIDDISDFEREQLLEFEKALLESWKGKSKEIIG